MHARGRAHRGLVEIDVTVMEVVRGNPFAFEMKMKVYVNVEQQEQMRLEMSRVFEKIHAKVRAVALVHGLTVEVTMKLHLNYDQRQQQRSGRFVQFSHRHRFSGNPLVLRPSLRCTAFLGFFLIVIYLSQSICLPLAVKTVVVNPPCHLHETFSYLPHPPLLS